jgi:RNA polymerase sigma-70 factor (ECF subfamily)
MSAPEAELLEERFLRRAAPAWRALFSAEPDARVDLAERIERALASHPGLAMPPSELAEALGERAGPHASRQVLAALAVEDVLVVFAAVRGDTGALARLRARLMTAVSAASRALRTPALFEEGVQRLSQSLLVAQGGAPGIARYTGRGPLDAFLRVAATRTLVALRDRERATEPVDADALDAPLDQLRDPELEVLKRRHRADVNRAFRAAIAALSSRERAVLRLHLESGLSIDRIGLCYRVHRATAARWLVRARERLLEEMHRALVTQLGLDPAEATSLARLLHSQIDVSLGELMSKSR